MADLFSDAPPESRRRALVGRRIVIVDDDGDARDLLETLLGIEGALVRSASSAEEALALLAISLPHVLLSDIGMPGRDGYWLVRQVRERWPGVCAVALSALTRPEDVRCAEASGFHLHISKPVEPRRLVSILATCRGVD